MSSGNFPDVLPEMSIKESNGEVSASIEETNRVRALLGLKPLNVGSSSSKPKKDNNTSKQLDQAQNTESIEKLHLKLQHKHRLKTAIRGISLSEELQSNNLENYSAADWIKKSRELEKKHKKEKKLVNKHMNELFDNENDIIIPDNDTKYLKGKIVNHDMSSFKSGETRILILKDTKILNDKMDINEDEDELINVEMYEKEIRQNKLLELENIKRNRKYDPFDDENNNVLLPQYKEKNDITKNKNAFTLNEHGNINSEQIIAALENDDAMNADYENKTQNKVKMYDLSDLNAQKTVGSDYVIKFKKKKKKKKKKKSKKRKRKTMDMDADIHEDEIISLKKRKIEDIPVELQQEFKEDKYAFLDDDKTTKSQSRGKRDEILTALKLADIEETKRKQKMDRYNIAIEKANKSMIENLAMNDIINELNNEDSEDDDIFRQALKRAEIIENKKTESINKIFMENEERAKDKQKNQMNIDDEENDEGVVVNITTQFSDGLNNVIDEMNEDNEIIIKNQEMELEQYDVENAVIVNDETAAAATGGWVECDGDSRPNISKREHKISDTQHTADHELLNNTILEKEPLVASSISETLAHIKRRGYLENEDDMGMEGGVLKASNIGISKQKREDIKRWSVSETLKWLKKNDNYLYNKYKEKILLKRIDGTQLLNSCPSKSFLQGVIGMNPDGYDIHKFMKILGDLCGDPAPDINLIYNDDHGKPMSKKEAFRKLSHKFHGKKSGPKKEEKRIKKRGVELQMKINNNIDTPLQTLSKLKHTTKTLNKPFVVLDKQ